MRKGRKKKSANFLATDEDDDFGVEESLNFTTLTGARMKSLSTRKNYLNTSTSSSETNSDELAIEKPKYIRYTYTFLY